MIWHYFMFSGGSVRVRFKSPKSLVNEIIDWFGKDTEFSNISTDEINVTVKVNKNAIFYWLMQYEEYVEVLEPDNLRENVEAVKGMIEKYGIGGV